MGRRVDTKTAELVEIALLTRSAFEQKRAEQYAQIAGLPRELIEEIFARPSGSFRTTHSSGHVLISGDRRKSPR
jgi:hypothetical protein